MVGHCQRVLSKYSVYCKIALLQTLNVGIVLDVGLSREEERADNLNPDSRAFKS